MEEVDFMSDLSIRSVKDPHRLVFGREARSVSFEEAQNSKSYSWYNGTRCLAITDNYEVEMRTVTSPTPLADSKFLKRQSTALPESLRRGLQCSDDECFLLYSEASKRLLSLDLKENSHPQLTTKSYDDIGDLSTRTNSHVIMKEYKSNRCGKQYSTALYFPTGNGNYYVNPEEDGNRVTVLPGSEKNTPLDDGCRSCKHQTDGVPCKYLLFSDEYHNKG